MKKKILLVVSVILCAALLVAGSIAGTLAYLTAKVTVVNTFSVGEVYIDLTESLVDVDGTPVANATRVHRNEYHLIPGSTYTKDPKITIRAGCEPAYLFVKVVNGLAEFALTEAEEALLHKKSIRTQMKENGWVLLDEANNIYVYMGYLSQMGENNQRTGVMPKMNEVQTVPVFETFTIKGSADLSRLPDADGNGFVDPKIEVTAYAVQASGFDSPAEAWAATFADANFVPSGNTVPEASTPAESTQTPAESTPVEPNPAESNSSEPESTQTN